MMDFSMLPPEINSTNLYAGPGGEPLLAAASAWAETAADVGITAAAIGQVAGGLTAAWRGPSAMAMTQSVMAYASWLTAASEQAAQSASAASAALAAYESAFAMTVPPPVIAANRAQLMALVATNFLGVNTPAIMLTEALYAEMWAQDALAMNTYAATSAAAVGALPTFNPPQQVANPATPAPPAAAGLGDPLTGIWNWLTSPNDFLTALNNPATPVGLAEAQWLSTASSGPWQSLFMLLTAGLMGQANGMMSRSNDLTYEGNRISERLAFDDERQLPRGVVNPGEAPTFPPPQSRVGDRSPTGFGRAGTVGNLSVPPGWNGASRVELASAATPLPTGGSGAPMMPMPIAAVNAPKKERRKGEEVLVVKFELPKGV